MSTAAPSRLARLLGGWSANLAQTVLGVTQQLALVPIFLHFASGETLAAWLALYAAGSLTQAADAGLQSRTINRFLALKSGADGEGRTATVYASMRRLYLGLTAILVMLVVVGTWLFRPSKFLGFRDIADFDTAFVIVIVGMLMIVPSLLPSALYRTRGLYGRAAWLQAAAMLVSQLAQAAAIATSGRLSIIAAAFVVPQLLSALYLFVDAQRLFPQLARPRNTRYPSWRWCIGQFRRAFPFAIANGTEAALQNLPVLLLSAIVTDRVAVAQWGLTRVVAGLVRVLCLQVALPLAAELGHDRAIGAQDALRRLYARGSVLVTLMASVIVSGLLAFWQDFFALWTHAAIPYDRLLTFTLLIGAELVAPAILASSYSYYSDRGRLLARTKGLQLVAFVILSLALTPLMGPLGTAIAVVGTDIFVQFGLLASAIIWTTLDRPVRHMVFLFALMVATTTLGWGMGVGIRSMLPLDGFARLIVECSAWLAIMAIPAVPLLTSHWRTRLSGWIPS